MDIKMLCWFPRKNSLAEQFEVQAIAIFITITKTQHLTMVVWLNVDYLARSIMYKS